jgi:hypothetical protein
MRVGWARSLGQYIEMKHRRLLFMTPKLSVGEFSVYLETEVSGNSHKQLLVECDTVGYYISDWAKDIMTQPMGEPGKKEIVKFARATVSDLGFNKTPTTRELLLRIQELGHGLCKPQDGSALRIALKNQPRGDYFCTAMEPILDSKDRPIIFGVGHGSDGVLWLDAYWADSDDRWHFDFEIVFRFCK